MMMILHRENIKVIAEALAMAAARRESMVRAGYGSRRGSRRDHRLDAESMRSVRAQLTRLLEACPLQRDFRLG